MTKKRNMVIIILLIIGAIALCVVEFGIKAKIHRQHQQYEVAQLNPQTNDFANIIKFKNRYMGNNSNDANLHANLPLADVPHTFSIHPTTRELGIRYTKSMHAIGVNIVQSSLVYNATAYFALIDNLNAITFVFPGTSYHVTRARVQSWYSVAPSKLTNQSSWNQDVQSKLSDSKYVTSAFHAFFGRTN